MSPCSRRLENARLALARIDRRFEAAQTTVETSRIAIELVLADGARFRATVEEAKPPHRGFVGWRDVWQEDGISQMHRHLVLDSGAREGRLLAVGTDGKLDERILTLFQPAIAACVLADAPASGAGYAGKYRVSAHVAVIRGAAQDTCRGKAGVAARHIVITPDERIMQVDLMERSLDVYRFSGGLRATGSLGPLPGRRLTHLQDDWRLAREGRVLRGELEQNWELPGEPWSCRVQYEVVAQPE